MKTMRLSYGALAVALLAGTPLNAAEPETPESETRMDALSGDIVVTARKREEKAQDIPLGLSGFPCVGGRLNITPPWL